MSIGDVFVCPIGGTATLGKALVEVLRDPELGGFEVDHFDSMRKLVAIYNQLVADIKADVTPNAFNQISDDTVWRTDPLSSPTILFVEPRLPL